MCGRRPDVCPVEAHRSVRTSHPERKDSRVPQQCAEAQAQPRTVRDGLVALLGRLVHAPLQRLLLLVHARQLIAVCACLLQQARLAVADLFEAVRELERLRVQGSA